MRSRQPNRGDALGVVRRTARHLAGLVAEQGRLERRLAELRPMVTAVEQHLRDEEQNALRAGATREMVNDEVRGAFRGETYS